MMVTALDLVSGLVFNFICCMLVLWLLCLCTAVDYSKLGLHVFLPLQYDTQCYTACHFVLKTLTMQHHVE